MTAKQKANRERFKKVVAEAKKLRQKNPKLTQAQAVARAWAISYGKKAAAKKKKVGATKIIQKGESKNAKVTKVLQQTRTKKGQFKGYKRIGRHTDTKSHNVNIRVVSGIEKTISGMKRKYIAIYETKDRIIGDEIFEATSLLEAKRAAQFHKRMSPEYRSIKNLRTSVKLYGKK